MVLVWKLDLDVIHEPEHRRNGRGITIGQSNVLRLAFLEESALFDMPISLATYAGITRKGGTEPGRVRAQNHFVCMEHKLFRLAIANGNIRQPVGVAESGNDISRVPC
jgi:hypothetical protein